MNFSSCRSKCWGMFFATPYSDCDTLLRNVEDIKHVVAWISSQHCKM
jgi:hypothetical protein